LKEEEKKSGRKTVSFPPKRFLHFKTGESKQETSTIASG
jgi:hypothetical protein